MMPVLRFNEVYDSFTDAVAISIYYIIDGHVVLNPAC